MAGTTVFQQFAKITNTKGERRGTHYMFSKPFRKHGVVPLITYMGIAKKGDTVEIKGMDTVQKGKPHKCYHGKTRRVCSVTQHAVGIVNKQVKGKIVAKRIHVCMEHIKYSKSRDIFLKCEGKLSEKEESQRERYLGSAEAPACSNQRSSFFENQ
uniref:60S ribosomal protein L21 n=1 Tax=Catagonus wagneri TaxID=51154 RepID=A0A8C3W1V3_9CETA